jgi:hypothetical protein
LSSSGWDVRRERHRVPQDSSVSRRSASCRGHGTARHPGDAPQPLAIALADVGAPTSERSRSVWSFALSLLSRARPLGSRGWIAPWLLAHLVWLNLHGGFVAGALLLGGYTVEAGVRSRRVPWHLVGTGAAMAALVPLNPYGLDAVRYLARALLMPRPQISEWLPVWTNPAFAVLLVISLEPVIYAAWRLGVRALPGALTLLLFRSPRCCTGGTCRCMRSFSSRWCRHGSTRRRGAG